jgi:large subunit ribosomal protein L20
MTRVRNGVVTKQRHKKILKEARCYFGSKHREFKSAKEHYNESKAKRAERRRVKAEQYKNIKPTLPISDNVGSVK